MRDEEQRRSNASGPFPDQCARFSAAPLHSCPRDLSMKAAAGAAGAAECVPRTLAMRKRKLRGGAKVGHALLRPRLSPLHAVRRLPTLAQRTPGYAWTRHSATANCLSLLPSLSTESRRSSSARRSTLYRPTSSGPIVVHTRTRNRDVVEGAVSVRHCLCTSHAPGRTRSVEFDQSLLITPKRGAQARSSERTKLVGVELTHLATTGQHEQQHPV